MIRYDHMREIEKLGERISSFGPTASGLEDFAIKTINRIYADLQLPNQQPACALLRFFHTMPLSSLQDQAQVHSRKHTLNEDSNCLTLLATRGQVPDWNSRLKSKEHQAIPMQSVELVKKMPMVAAMIDEIGVPADRMVKPSPTNFINPSSKSYKNFFIADAPDSTALEKSKFVNLYGIRSVLGLGGLTTLGATYVIIGFFKRTLAENEAEHLTGLSRHIEAGLNQIPAFQRKLPKILVADVPEGIARVAKCLGLRHDLVVAENVDQVMNKLETQPIDLILCGMHFDESRMFDLLNLVKSDARWKYKPFICIREVNSAIFDEAKSSIVMSANSLGACFIDTLNMTDADVKSAIESYIPRQIWLDSNLAEII
ncbi:MAG TPA: hypothetical protein V6C76_06870 [Drouetiella sp.]